MTSTAPGSSSHLRTHWGLEPNRVFLNHGSYGACPRSLIEEQNSLRWILEQSPSEFMNRLYPKLLKGVREEVCDFLKCDVQEFVFITNATSGVNVVLRSIEWKSGDEILTTDHGYNACHNVVSHLEKTQDVKAVRVSLPFPEVDASELVERILAAVSPRTKLALLDHVSSPTGLVFPLERLASGLRERGVEVLVDGAHAPGMLDLNLTRLSESGVSYYTGNFHKWCCAPRGSAFLWVRRQLQDGLHPGVISHGYSGPSTDSRFHQEFDWCGTFDPTAWLVVPSALRYLAALFPGGWSQLHAEGHALLLQARNLVASALPPQELVPETMLGLLASLELSSEFRPEELYRKLYDQYGIDSWTTSWNGRTLIRLSAAPYNELEDFQKLADALGEIL